VTLTDPELEAIKHFANESPQRYSNLSRTVVEQENLTQQQFTQTLNRTIDILEEEQSEDEQLREYVEEQERQSTWMIWLLVIILFLAGFGVLLYFGVKTAIESQSDTRM
jgi:type VI protein secretion system component VasF